MAPIAIQTKYRTAAEAIKGAGTVNIKFSQGIRFPADPMTHTKFANDANFTCGIIYSTKSYRSFSLLPGNRELVEAHVKELMKEIETENLLHAHPILVNEFGGVVDGQHRLEAAERMGVPIFFFIVSGLGSAHVGKLNSLQKNWATLDYVQAHADKESYSVLLAYSEKYELSMNQAMTLCGYNTAASRAELKVGALPGITESDQDAADKAGSILQYLVTRGADKKQSTSTKFIAALVRFVKSPSYDEKVLKHKLTLKSIPPCSNRTDYLQALVDIYNFKNSKRILVNNG